MKKFLKKMSLTSLLIGTVVALGTAEASLLPASAQKSFSVINVSLENKDATQVGARPGDVLRYELKINSPSENVVEFIPEFNMTDILSKAELIDAGLAQVNGNTLIFPPYSQAAPCQKEFSFFVRLKPCEQINGVKQIIANEFGKNLVVPIQCDGKPPVLIDTGSSIAFLGVIGLGAIMITFIIMGAITRRS